MEKLGTSDKILLGVAAAGFAAFAIGLGLHNMEALIAGIAVGANMVAIFCIKCHIQKTLAHISDPKLSSRVRQADTAIDKDPNKCRLQKAVEQEWLNFIGWKDHVQQEAAVISQVNWTKCADHYFKVPRG